MMEDQYKDAKQVLEGCFIYHDEKGDYRILPWEDSFALEQLNHGVWEEAKDHTRKYFDRRPLAGLHPTEINFLAKIPEEVKTICLRVEHCQYTCFKLLHDVPEAIGLACVQAWLKDALAEKVPKP